MKETKKIRKKASSSISGSDQLRKKLQEQAEFFNSGGTKDPAVRIEQLKKLKNVIMKYEAVISEALFKDLKKSEFEAFLAEIGIAYLGINHAVANVKKWAKPKRASTPFPLLPARSWTMAEPHGQVLIIAPWNYPFQLNIAPLIDAIAAGNTAVLKPSELAPHTSAVVAKIIYEAFDPSYVFTVEGGIEKTQFLLREKFDYIFFTGGTQIGKIIMEAASKNLTPLTLELGGKSPVIVDKNASLTLAAKKIAWGKFLNAGQTCTAPDYVLAHIDVKDELIKIIEYYVKTFYGTDPQKSQDYPRIINSKHFTRIKNLIKNTNIIFGGIINEKELYISPTVVKDVSLTHPVMKEEIFGPVLPVIGFSEIDDAISIVRGMSKPLALYLFTSDKKIERKILLGVSSGGVMINDISVQVANHHLPFGGVGLSGVGAYHGKSGFDTFSHIKSVMKAPRFIDIPLRYPPYKNKNKLKLLKFLFR